MATYHLDTSVAMQVFERTRTAAVWFDTITSDPDHHLSSRILHTELTRCLRREDIPVLERETVLRHVGLIELTEGILTGAEAILPQLRTLDAIHLASALAVGSEVVLASHDARLREVAEISGLATIDPV